MNGYPSMQQAIAEQRIHQFHAEAAHARQVKEARAARRANRSPSRIIGVVAAVRGFRPAPVAAYRRWYAKGQLTPTNRPC
jgi:hypothetical protein